jgi:hypothetical protein
MANAPTKGVDPYSIAGQLVGTFISIGFAKDNAKQQRKLQEKIAEMSLENQRQIQERLAQAQTDIERQRIAFQILALEKNEQLVERLEKDKYKSMVIVGVGAVALAVVIVLAKRKK